MYRQVCRKCSCAGAAIVTAIALAAGGVIAPRNYDGISAQARTETYLVQLQVAAIASTVVSSAAAEVEAAPQSNLASQTGFASQSPVTALARLAIGAVGLVLAPFWYIGFPVTLPLMAVLVDTSQPRYVVQAILAPIAPLILWVAFPFILPDLILSFTPAIAAAREIPSSEPGLNTPADDLTLDNSADAEPTADAEAGPLGHDSPTEAAAANLTVADLEVEETPQAVSATEAESTRAAMVGTDQISDDGVRTPDAVSAESRDAESSPDAERTSPKSAASRASTRNDNREGRSASRLANG